MSQSVFALSGLFPTILNLVNAGFAGVGIVVFLLLFILLIRNQEVTPQNERLRSQFLKYGVSFAVFCGVMSLLTPVLSHLLAPAPVKAEPQDLTLVFSPRFESRKLPPPEITLPDGSQGLPGKSFKIKGGLVQISIDDALASVSALQETAKALNASVAEYREQRDQAVEVAAAVRTNVRSRPASATLPTAAIVSEVQSSSTASETQEDQVARSIAAGDFVNAARASTMIRTAAERGKTALDQ